MPRLSLYRPNRTNDYRFFDRTISEMFSVGGLDLYLHKYLGPKVTDNEPDSGDATQPTYDSENPLFIQDLFLLENRDRSYDNDIYVMRGVYQAQDIDFDLTQFGLFFNNDTLFITFHYNDMIDSLGRKIMSGDVLEVPNLVDRHPLDPNLPKGLPKYYVVQDAAYASEGFSQTWQPHLWRVKATPMVNSQEYQDILNQPQVSENIWDSGNFYPAGAVVNDGDDYYKAKIDVPVGTPIDDATYWESVDPETLGDTASTRGRDLEINDAVLQQAEVEVPLSGYDTVKFYIFPTNEDGTPATDTAFTADGSAVTADNNSVNASLQDQSPRANGYTVGYLTGDGIPPNGLPVTSGVAFPLEPVEGDYALRLDYFPNRLFRYDGRRWRRIEDDVRTDLTNGPDNQTLRSSFVNNTDTVDTQDRGSIPSRQSLSDMLKPKADNGG